MLRYVTLLHNYLLSMKSHTLTTSHSLPISCHLAISQSHYLTLPHYHTLSVKSHTLTISHSLPISCYLAISHSHYLALTHSHTLTTLILSLSHAYLKFSLSHTAALSHSLSHTVITSHSLPIPCYLAISHSYYLALPDYHSRCYLTF